MINEKTLLLIKPDMVAKKKIGEIISILEKNEININEMFLIKLTKENAETFYFEHKNKSFFNELISFMTSNNIIALILSGKNIIEKTRELIGDTNYQKAKENTIRYKYAESLTKNAVHASDSYESSVKEINFIKKIIKNEL